MTMLANKPSFPAPMGAMGHTTQYQSANAAYRTPILGSNNISSPTESEFSESSRVSDSVRCVMQPSSEVACAMFVKLTGDCTGTGTKTESANGSSV